MKLPPLVAAMKDPGFYPHRPPAVRLVQTHASWVFLTGELAYKVKKPVDFGFLNYSTLPRRGAQCRREVELNSRLAPGVYLGVRKIYRRGNRFSLDSNGRLSEYTVVMRQLPERCLLTSWMSRGRATRRDLRRVAAVLAEFHRRAPVAAGRNSRLGVLWKNCEENVVQTAPYIGRTVSREDYEFLLDYNRGFLGRHRHLLTGRIAAGRVRDGHGDLHAEHICLGSEVIIFDCLEFSPRLRQADVAADIAFLYMDLLFHGHPRLAKAFIEEYLRLTGDWEVRLLLSFFACYRAVVREKVESFRLADPHVSARRKQAAARRARHYSRLARHLAERDIAPRLVVVAGLPGSGKTTLARRWAALTGGLYLGSDEVRRKLAGRAPEQSLKSPWRTGFYSSRWTGRTYREMSRLAGEALASQPMVVLDATCADPDHRRMIRKAARDAGARFVCAECVLAPRASLERLSSRLGDRGASSDAGPAVYRAMKRRYRPWAGPCVRIDSSLPLDERLARMGAAAFPL